jgi:manganese oxidase
MKTSSLIALLIVVALFTPAARSQGHYHGTDHSQMQHAQSSDQEAPPKKTASRSAPPHPVSVVTPDVPHLPWTMENNVKVFHLTAEIVKRELLPASPMGPAKVLTVWGYNGSVPGPTIEVNEGDHVRIIFHNKLPEDTTVHWHGLELPINMDGMPFISQPPVKPGGSYVYEFKLHQNGTFFYHSHGAMQEMMGMIGFFIIHPKSPHNPPVHKDFGIVLQEFGALQNNPVPNSMSMEFNWLTFNGKAAPATTPLIVRQGDRVRIRLINLGMDHHPIHIHGNQFYVTGTEGGRIPQSAWFPGNTVIVGVAQARDIEFDAIYPGDWMLHCHLPHHMMNNMVSMVGPMSHVGHGMHTGGGMEEGMGIIKQGSATDEDLGPALGRGMGNTVDREQPTSHSVGHPAGSGDRTIATSLGTDPNSQRGPGYPQDQLMMMQMDASVAKPQNNYLAPGWSSMMQGMMNLVRVLPPDKYDQLVADIKAGRIDPAQLNGGMDHSKMQHGTGQPMDHSNMPGMDHSKMDHGTGPTPVDHSKMQHGSVRVEAPLDHSKMQHGSQQAPMDHSKMKHGKMPGMDHGKMQHRSGADDTKKHKQSAKPAAERAALEAQMEASRKQMEASRKQMEASRKLIETVSPSDKGGKKGLSDQEDSNHDHSKMGH